MLGPVCLRSLVHIPEVSHIYVNEPGSSLPGDACGLCTLLNIFLIFSEGINLATKYGSKYIEVSAILNHRVDELLVGILRQIRLKPERGLDDGNTTCLSQVSNLGCLPRGAYDLMCNVFRKDDDATRSCENLLAL